MDEKKLHYEFMSISGESHPGLTFEEYRDSCVFLLFYQYLCLKYADSLEDGYKLSEMVRLAVRGKLQMPAFLHFIEAAASFLHLLDDRFQLTDFSFYQKLIQVRSLEKQKSYARFFRKLIKKIDGWEADELLLACYPELFGDLMKKFSQMRKETFLSGDICKIFRLFFEHSGSGEKRLFLPEFGYGLLVREMTEKRREAELYGYESEENLVEIFFIQCYMSGKPMESVHLFLKKDWEKGRQTAEAFDRIAIYRPEGAKAGELLCHAERLPGEKELFYPGTKGELPFLVSALCCLKKKGSLAVIFPGAFLYREGKEAQMRKYLIEELNCLDTVMWLPDTLFQSAGQAEVFLFLKLNRKETDVMFLDCSETEEFGEDQMKAVETAWLHRESVPGFSACVKKAALEKNEYNLNLPRYIAKPVKEKAVDIEESRKRIAEIDRELLEVEKKIAMYRRELEI